MGFVRVAGVGDLQPGQMTSVRLEKVRIALARVGDGYYAFDDTCSHMREPLSEGSLDGHCVYCPMHQSGFDVRTGAALTPPASEPVGTYAVRVADGAVWIDPDLPGG